MGRKLLSLAIAAAIGAMAAPTFSAPFVRNAAVGIVGAGATADPLVAVEANRTAIVNRLVANYSQILGAAGVDASSFRTALGGLRADQLLAASLVSSIEEVTAIVSQTPADGASLQRFYSVVPTTPTSMLDIPAASAYLVRNGNELAIVAASSLELGGSGSVVGYFAPGSVAAAVAAPAMFDGPGTGANSWIGYTSGGNQATGSGSAVAAGVNNLASGQGSFVGAGTANQANGTSSLVMGGFDNRAVAIDSVVIGGAGHRATGARAFIGGGGYNLASGNFSFIGGGGRDGIGSGAAGTDLNRDHRAFGKWSFIGGGTGNVTGVSGSGDSVRSSAVVGGARNTASGPQAFIGAGGCNVASGTSSVVVGGGQTADTGGCIFGNVASGAYSFVGAGFDNIAAGISSVALGQGAQANQSSTFVFSDGTTYASNGANTFNVQASGGLFVSPSTSIQMGSQVRQNITLWGAANQYGIGVQSGTQYFRTGSAFAWFQGGVHNDNTFNPGAGGTRVLTLEQDSSLTFGSGSTNGEHLKLSPVNRRSIGSQLFTTYIRTNSNVAFFNNGTHNDNELDPGTGGSVLASIQVGVGSGTRTGNVRALAFTATSDRESKSDFANVDTRAILAKVAALPVSTWTYKAEEGMGVRHIGPVAQDFALAFQVGYDDKSISTVDASGVALSAIKGLIEEARERDALIAAQAAEIASLKSQMAKVAEAQDDLRVVKATLAELLRERAAAPVQVKLINR